MIEWGNSHAGLIVIGIAVLFVVILAFQKTRGGPV